jgi:hypothetical protein
MSTIYDTPQPKPLTITVKQACEMSGYRKTTIYKLRKTGKLKKADVAGVRRALIEYASFEALFKGDGDTAE